MADNQSSANLNSKEYLQKLRERRAQRRTLTGQNIKRSNPVKRTEPPKTSPVKTKKTQTTTNDVNEFLPDFAIEESRVAPGLYKPLPEQTIFEWKAPSRPFKKRKKQFFSSVFIITLLIFLILVFVGQWLAGAVAVSVAFLIYVLSFIPPNEITNKITTYGIRVEDIIYYWEELGRFWFTKKYGQELLHIETMRFPGRIVLLLKKSEKNIVNNILSEALLNEKPDPTLYDKVSKWLGEKIPLET